MMEDFGQVAAKYELPTPRVSVLMPVFNTALYLKPALTSISIQSFSDFELVVVDDGSTDGSTELLRAYADTEPRMRLTARGNRGLIATRNELLRIARGELIAWMDSDDISLQNRLQLQINRFDVDPDLVCLGGVAQCIDPEGHPLNVERYPLMHEDILQEQLKGGAMRFPTTMMRREAAIDVGGFREPFKMGEDFDLLLRLSEIGKMANISETIYLYRQHLSSVCATLGSQWKEYRDQILSLARERHEVGTDKLQRGDTLTIRDTSPIRSPFFVSRTYAFWAQQCLVNGDRSLALRYARSAIFAQPIAALGWKTLLRAMLNLKPVG